MPKPRILYYVQNDWFFASHRLPLAREAKRRGWDVAVACRVDRHREHIEAEGIRVIALRSMDVRNRNPLGEVGPLREILRILRAERPDLLHNVSLRPVMLGGLAARLSGVPAVVNAVTGLGWLFSSSSFLVRLLRWLMVLPMRVGHRHPNLRTIFQNADDLAVFRRLGIVRPGQEAMIHGSGVDLERYRPGAATDKAAPPAVIMASRMLRPKGIEDLVEAAGILQTRGVECDVLLVGSPDPGNPAAISEEELGRWHARGTVTWLGRRDDVPDLLRRSAVACLPSYYGEGIPRFLLEAAACGLPVVTTDTPGCREVVDEGENGFLTPPRSPEALADALARLLQDAGMRKSFGVASREKALQRYGIEEVVRRHMAIYDELLSISSRKSES